MSETAFGYEFVSALARHSAQALGLAERTGADGGPWLRFTLADGSADAGFLRLWAGQDAVDRMLHARLRGDPADTNLFFIFGAAATAMPHFHAQAVQFASKCVYNADLLPRLDPVEHPEHFQQVFGPITKPFWRATQNRENTCAAAPGNPAIAVYLSPWSIGASRPTDQAELERVGPQIQAYLDHYIALAADPPGHGGLPGPALAARDARHLALFFAEDLDPRAWKGVYRLIGPDAGARLRDCLMQSLRP
jgi:hypothetical protein